MSVPPSDGNLTPPSPLSMNGEGGAVPHPPPLSREAGEGSSEDSPSPSMERGPGGEVSSGPGGEVSSGPGGEASDDDLVPRTPRPWRRWLLAAAVASLLALGLAAASYAAWLDRPLGRPGGPPLAFVLEPGTGFGGVLAVLEQGGIVDHPLFFRLHATGSGDASRSKAGTYVLAAETTPRQLWAALVKGPRPNRPLVTLPEGSTIWRVEDVLADAGVDPYRDLLELARDRARAAVDPRLAAFLPLATLGSFLDAHPEYTLLEGLLAPDTYDLAPGDAPDVVLRRLTDRFFAVWTDAAGDAASFTVNGVTLTPYQLLTLASLVEREVRVPDERPLVASVFWNRLAKGMRLETDPTLVYTPLYDGQVPTPAHRVDASNPYNTYAHDGLPPTPIGSPGRAAIRAARLPAATDYLFFVARGDASGRHYFAPTYDEHRRNVIYAQRERLKRGE